MRKFYSQDLQRQYDHDSHFRQRVSKSQIIYSQALKQSIDFNPVSEGLHDSMLQKFIGEDGHETYFFYGYLQPNPNRCEKQLVLYLVKNFQPEPGIPFTFVYFNHKTPSSDFFFKFKAVFDLIPLRVIEKMRSFYLVKPYFYIKAFDWLGHSNKVFAERYQTLDNCTELVKRLDIKVHDFVTFVPEDISEEFPSNIKRRPSLLNYRINYEGQSLSEDQLQEKHDFELSIKALITKEIYRLQNYELGQMGIPRVIQLLVGYFKEKPHMLIQEGIFRKSVSIDEENETLEELSSRNFGYLEQITNPHLIASLIKKFFSNLKEPIIPFALFDKLMHDQGISNKKEFVKQIIQSLPTLNFLTLMFVIGFLKEDVVPLEKQTLMSGHNLAICFSPALMRSQKASFADIVNASKAVTVTDIMITDYDSIFGNKMDRNNLYQKSMIDRRKNFKKNIGEGLNIEIDDRASEEVRTNSFLKQEIPTHPPQHVQIGNVTNIVLTKQVYKNESIPERTTKSEIRAPKTEEFMMESHQQVKHPSSYSQEITIDSHSEEPQEIEHYTRAKKSKQDLVEKYLKKQNKLEHQEISLSQQTFEKKQQPHQPTPIPHPQEKPSVTRSSIFFTYQGAQK